MLPHQNDGAIFFLISTQQQFDYRISKYNIKGLIKNITCHSNIITFLKILQASCSACTSVVLIVNASRVVVNPYTFDSRLGNIFL